VDLCQRVRSIVAVASHDAQVKHIELSLQACEPGVLVLADAVRLDQIIWNLLSNALKFTPAGGRVTVRISIEQTNVRLDVIDTGQGIDPGFITDVFDMFRQANARSVRHDSGLGIGLAIVKQLVEAHGGRVEASSPGLNQGARFSFWLPVRYDAALPTGTLQLTDTALTQGLRILLVDDLADASEALAMLLEIEGARVTTARGGGEALSLLKANEFDLLISDIAMPDMDGYELVAALRKLPGKRTLPAIALTGFGRRHDQDKALNAGFDAHIGKPVSLEDLRKTINELTVRKFQAS
jgi:two-component system CheB/CheR fusion protein